jgi:hypothetical protein
VDELAAWANLRLGRELKVGLATVLAFAIGATIAWLWTGKDGVAALTTTPELQNAATKASAFPNAQAGKASVLPGKAPAAAPIPSPAVQAVSGTRDDSTYFRVLAAMQGDPQAAAQLRPLMAWHERFVLTPDDPDWGRRMEQALREFLRKQSALGRLEITSVSCRSENCEVQLLGDLSDSPVPANEGLMMPPKELIVAYPVGPSLREQAAIRMGLGDRTAIILMYRRVRPETELDPGEAR